MSFKENIKAGKTMLGTLLTLPSAEIADAISRLGFDWLWIDMEHSVIDLARMQSMLQAIGGRCPALVRVPWNDHVWIKRVLDTGCDGVIIPQIRSAEEAKAAVSACRYPPQGVRGVAGGRAQGYGLGIQEYLKHANDRMVIVMQIEHIEAVQQIDAILAVEGIDAVMIGPFDLSASMGLIGQLTHPQVTQVIETVRDACRKRYVPAGIFTPNAESARRWKSEGFTLIPVGTDSAHLMQAAGQALAAVKG